MFIFWKGNGILLPLFALLGAMVGVGVGMSLDGGGVSRSLRPMSIGVIAGTWLYILMCDKRPGGASFYFLPMKFWAVLITGLSVFWIVHDPKADMPAPRGDKLANAARGDGERAFRSAESWLGQLSGEPTAGNTPQAQRLAEQYSAAIETFRSMAIEGSTSDDFRCYCFLGDKTCAFLVRAPRLRKFTDDAKHTIHAAAWRAAVNVCRDDGLSPRRIGVGVRGISLYSGVMVGSANLRMPDVGRDKDSLISFFSKPNSDPDAVEPQAGDSPVGETETTHRQLPTVVRTWTADDGRPMEASLRGFTEDSPPKAIFERKDGKTFDIELERFSPASRQEIMSYLPERKDPFTD